MWAVEVLATGGESTYLVASSGGLDAYRALAPPIRAGGQFLGTLVIALVVLGLLQESGPRSVRTVRRSPIISCCIGLPGALVIAGLAQTGSLLLGSSLGIFFGIPFVIFGLTVLPLLTTIGVVAIGQTITTRVGRDGLGAGVLAGSALAGLRASHWVRHSSSPASRQYSRRGRGSRPVRRRWIDTARRAHRPTSEQDLTRRHTLATRAVPSQTVSHSRSTELVDARCDRELAGSVVVAFAAPLARNRPRSRHCACPSRVGC